MQFFGLLQSPSYVMIINCLGLAFFVLHSKLSDCSEFQYKAQQPIDNDDYNDNYTALLSQSASLKSE